MYSHRTASIRTELSFFDTEVDSVRSFDPNTQRSVENLASVEIFPAEQILADKSLF